MSEHEDDEEQRIVTAEHEAAHGVMRCLRGQRATRLHVFNANEGLSEGTGRRIPAGADLDITLAGPAWELRWEESINPSFDIADSRRRSDDLSKARAILETALHLRGIDDQSLTELNRCLAEGRDSSTVSVRMASVDEALRRQFDRVLSDLRLHEELVRRVGRELAKARTLSAMSVAAFCREHKKRHPSL